MITFRGRNTPITRGARRFWSSRKLCSSWATSTVFSLRATPTRWQKSRMDSGVYPRRRRPESVGILGSSQPETWLSATNSWSRRLLIMVLVKFKRANSICCGW